MWRNVEEQLLEQLDKGEFLTYEEVGARLDQMVRR